MIILLYNFYNNNLLLSLDSFNLRYSAKHPLKEAPAEGMKLVFIRIELILVT